MAAILVRAPLKLSSTSIASGASKSSVYTQENSAEVIPTIKNIRVIRFVFIFLPI